MGISGSEDGRAPDAASSVGRGVCGTPTKGPSGEASLWGAWWGGCHPDQKELEIEDHFCPGSEDTRGLGTTSEESSGFGREMAAGDLG